MNHFIFSTLFSAFRSETKWKSRSGPLPAVIKFKDKTSCTCYCIMESLFRNINCIPEWTVIIQWEVQEATMGMQQQPKFYWKVFPYCFIVCSAVSRLGFYSLNIRMGHFHCYQQSYLLLLTLRFCWEHHLTSFPPPNYPLYPFPLKDVHPFYFPKMYFWNLIYLCQKYISQTIIYRSRDTLPKWYKLFQKDIFSIPQSKYLRVVEGWDLNHWHRLGLENEWTLLKGKKYHQKFCFTIKMYNRWS